MIKHLTPRTEEEVNEHLKNVSLKELILNAINDEAYQKELNKRFGTEVFFKSIEFNTTAYNTGEVEVRLIFRL